MGYTTWLTAKFTKQAWESSQQAALPNPGLDLGAPPCAPSLHLSTVKQRLRDMMDLEFHQTWRQEVNRAKAEVFPNGTPYW